MSKTLYLAHHGIKGQKWGVRRFQNEDGSLTPAGKSRYYNYDGSLNGYGRRIKSQRDAKVKSLETEIESLNDEHALSKKELYDLRKNGTHSVSFKDRYGAYSDQEFEETFGVTKKEMLKDMIAEQKSLVEENAEDVKEIIPQLRERIALIQKTPIDQISEVERDDVASAVGFAVWGTMMGATMLGTLASPAGKGAILIGGSILSLIGGAVASGKKTEQMERLRYKG